MNGVLMENIPLSSKTRPNTSYKHDSFLSKKRNAKTTVYEKKPLMSADTDSSDEEITLHDIRYITKPIEVETFGLRKIKKLDVCNSNGIILENPKSSDPFQHCEFLDLRIEEGDTLQSISIKYQCTVSDIKRANNLISDQDFFALTHLKIPVKKYSLLTEILLPSIETKENSTYLEEYDNDTRTINIGIGSAGRSPSPQEAAAFFKRMDEDLVKIMMSTNSQKDSLEAAAVVLTAPQIQPLVKDPYNTVDCGIQWNYLLIFIVLFAVVVPTAIALYIYMRSPHETHPDVYPNDSSNENYNPVSKLDMKAKS